MIRPGSREVLRVSAFRGSAAAASRTGHCIGVEFATSKLRYANTRRRKPSPFPRKTAAILQFGGSRGSRDPDTARRRRHRFRARAMGRYRCQKSAALSARAGDLLPQLRQERCNLPAVALNHRREFIALRYFHADATDIHIGDLQSTAAVYQKPVDLDRRRTRTSYLAGHDNLVARRPAAGDPERRAAILAESGAVGLDDIFLEQLQEFLLLLRSGRAPIAAEHELADARDIEIILQQFAKSGLPLLRRHARPQDLDRSRPERADKGARVRRHLGPRTCGQNRQHQNDGTAQGDPADHSRKASNQRGGAE